MTTPNTKTKKILTIDGGGIKGVFPASFLANLENDLEVQINEYFDLIAGTSTGGIIAIALGLGISSSEILSFYRDYGPNIFGSPVNRLYQIFTSKYKKKNLESALQDVFAEKKLGDSSTRLLVPSLNYRTGEVYINKTAHHKRLKQDYKKGAVEVALSTSAAPSYFPIHQLASNTLVVDGGVWSNNPTGIAVVEAIGWLDWNMDNIEVLSIGCTKSPTNLEEIGSKAKGLLHWVNPLKNRGLELAMRGQSSGANGIAYTLTSHEQITRINPTVSSAQNKMDNIELINKLEALGADHARHGMPSVEKFFKNKVDEFKPVYEL